MKSLRLFLLAFAATITIGAVAQDSVIPSKLRVQSVGVNVAAPARGQILVTAASGVTTPIHANGDGTNDVEVLVNSPAGANSYVRTTNISGVNWSFGNRRSDGLFVFSNAVGLGTPAATLSSAGVFNVISGGDVRINGASVVFSPASPTFTGTTTIATLSVSGAATITGVSTIGGANVGRSNGNYVGTVVGCTTNPGPVVVWNRSGDMVSVSMSPFTCTSNSGLFTISGAPAAIRPTTANTVRAVVTACQNNSVQEFGTCQVYMNTSGVINIEYRGTSFTSSGTKGYGLTSGEGFTFNQVVN